METIIHSRIVGFTDGFAPNQRYLLQDGSEWEQVSATVRTKWLQSPQATIIQRGGRYFIRVKGIRGQQEVRPVDDVRVERIVESLRLLYAASASGPTVRGTS